MAWLFTCPCGMQLLLAKGQERVRCPKCQHVLVVKRRPEKPGSEPLRARRPRRLAGAGLLLVLLLAVLGIFLLYGGPGEEALTGPWVLDTEAGRNLSSIPVSGGMAIDFQDGGTWAGRIPGGTKGGTPKGGTWKIVKNKGRQLTVELASPGQSPDCVEITLVGTDRLQLNFPSAGGSYELRRSSPGSAFPAPSRWGLQESGNGAERGGPSSQQDANYSLIETGLYMGGSVAEPPPGTRAVINLCEKMDSYRRNVRSYMWVPIADGEPAPRLDWLREMVRIVHARRRGGNTVFVHCRAGVSRSGLVVTAYCMFENQWTRDQALAFVRSKRPVTRPNPAFMKLLGDWELVLAK